MKPLESVRNTPARVYWRAPLSLVMKKPFPLIARSRLLPVLVMFPWVNCWAMLWVTTPLPTELRPLPNMEMA
ncbi:hypothetical protein D9M71_231140 [compost metagenome]